jgi:hypothetical protein
LKTNIGSRFVFNPISMVRIMECFFEDEVKVSSSFFEKVQATTTLGHQFELATCPLWKTKFKFGRSLG